MGDSSQRFQANTSVTSKVVSFLRLLIIARNTYTLIIVQKFSNRASEHLQYMETIRHAVKTHGGLGWCIYDHKFRYKAATACRTLSWANIDMQLWLRIFTASSTQLWEENSLFLTDPQTKLGQRGTEFATATTGVELAHYNPIAPSTLTDVTELAVAGTILGGLMKGPAVWPRATIVENLDMRGPS